MSIKDYKKALAEFELLDEKRSEALKKYFNLAKSTKVKVNLSIEEIETLINELTNYRKARYPFEEIVDKLKESIGKKEENPENLK